MSRRIGIIVATKKERAPFPTPFGKANNTFRYGPFAVELWIKPNCEIYLTRSGYGEIAAASATQYLIDRFDVEGIINYGVVGSLTEKYQVGDIGIVQKIVHYGFDLSGSGKYPVGRYPNEPGLFLKPKEGALTKDELKKLGRCYEFTLASADKFVEGGEAKRQLHKEYGADICDMESAGIVLVCNRNDIPCSFLKVVSDGVDEGEKEFNKNIIPASKACVEALATILLG